MFCFNQDPDQAQGHRKPTESTTESKVKLVEALFGACLVTLILTLFTVFPQLENTRILLSSCVA